MLPRDFRKYINDSPLKDRFNSLETTIDYSHLNSKIELKGIQSIYKFVFDQVIGWNNIENLPHYFKKSKSHFESLKSSIIDLVSSNYSLNPELFERKWNEFSPNLNSKPTHKTDYIFLYDSPEVDFLMSVYNKKNSYFQGAIDSITNTERSQNMNHDYYTGLIMAYEFKNQNDSEILHRRNNEKKSLGQIRDKYNEYIIEAEQQLNGYLSDAKENLTEHFESVDKLKELKKNNFDNWFDKTNTDFEVFFNTVLEKVKENEELFKEKLRLEAPAEYWKARASVLKKESKSYMNWLIGVSVISALFLFILLMTLGTGFFETAFNDSVKGIKWSIILITLVSFLAFTIRLLSKMAFSSLHLSRDAEEREQLTHFYLALKKDTTIEPEERQLILQSLFSRSDTGLLKEDSSPTMPSSFVERFGGGK